jgi:hypothetical protein
MRGNTSKCLINKRIKPKLAGYFHETSQQVLVHVEIYRYAMKNSFLKLPVLMI